jgi:hypothetical protein
VTLRAYTVEAWALTSPAAPHTARLCVRRGVVKATSDEQACEVFARSEQIPVDYWRMPRASAAATVPTRRLVRGQWHEVGHRHVPYIVLRAESGGAR